MTNFSNTPQNAQRGLIEGIRVFLSSAYQIAAFPGLRVWYQKTLLKTFIFAFIVVAVLLAGGLYFFNSTFLGLEGIWSGTASVLWILVVIYFSGTLSGLFLTALFSVIFDEFEMIQSQGNLKPVVSKKSVMQFLWSKDRRAEYKITLINIFISCFLWPAFFIPFLIPALVLIFAFMLGSETLALGNRLTHMIGEDSQKDRNGYHWGYAMGLGFVSSVFSLIPFLGWMTLPVLYYAGFKAQKV